MRLWIPALVFLSLCQPLNAMEARGPLPENWEIRQKLVDEFFSGPKYIKDRMDGEMVYDQEFQDHRVKRIFTQQKSPEGKNHYYILFVNELVEKQSFPWKNAGNVIVKMDPNTGALIQIKILLRETFDDLGALKEENGGSFLRIFPQGLGAKMEVVLFGEPLYTALNIPMTFRQALQSPLSDLVNRTKDLVDWDLIFPPRSLGGQGQMTLTAYADALRKELYSPQNRPRLREVEDGAMDQTGKFVKIEDFTPQTEEPGFNCSGMVKWAADGIAYAYTGKYLDIGPLKLKNLGDRGTDFYTDDVEYYNDPFFGLDWTRNIARALGNAREGKNLKGNLWDITANPFIRQTPGKGFPLGRLNFVLYWQAVKKPGRMLLASLNGPTGEGNNRMNRHFHTAVFFPFIDGKGIFQVRVFEVNLETNLKTFMDRGKTDGTFFVHLTEVLMPSPGKPLVIPPLPRP